MKNIFKTGLILCTALSAKAQLTVNSTMTPTQLVQNVLLGSGVTASNITFSGPNAARGEFNGTASNIGFPGGVILATGDISVAVGPNNNGSLSNSDLERPIFIKSLLLSFKMSLSDKNILRTKINAFTKDFYKP